MIEDMTVRNLSPATLTMLVIAFVGEQTSITAFTPFTQGSLEILATGPQVHCQAFVLEAGFANPFFSIPLVGTRDNQEAGAHE